MEYSKFVDDVKNCIRIKVDKEYEVKVNRVRKNNSVELDGIVFFKEGDRISPNIYLNSYYNRYMDGETVDTIANDIIHTYEESKKNQCVQYDEFEFEFEAMKDKITYRLINYEKNKPLLAEVPHIRFLDLAITFHCLIKQDSDGIGTIRITNEHMAVWNTTVKELMRLATENTKRFFPIKINTMEEIVSALIKQDFYITEDASIDMDEEMLEQMIQDMVSSKDSRQMYVLSNTLGINGATCLLYQDALKEFAKEKKSDFYILPSSIHEVILVPYEECLSKEELKNMVKEVNGSQVAVEEVLSDKVYLYHRNTNRVEI